MLSYSLKSNNSLEKFRKLVTGKRDIPIDLDPSFSPSGDFQVIEGIDVIVRSVTNILLICSETYVFDPELGIGLYKYIFEPADQITKESIEGEVSDQLYRYEGRASISSAVSFLDNKKGFRLDLTIKYQGQRRKLHIVFDESLLRTMNAND